MTMDDLFSYLLIKQQMIYDDPKQLAQFYRPHQELQLVTRCFLQSLEIDQFLLLDPKILERVQSFYREFSQFERITTRKQILCREMDSWLEVAYSKDAVGPEEISFYRAQQQSLRKLPTAFLSQIPLQQFCADDFEAFDLIWQMADVLCPETSSKVISLSFENSSEEEDPFAVGDYTGEEVQSILKSPSFLSSLEYFVSYYPIANVIANEPRFLHTMGYFSEIVCDYHKTTAKGNQKVISVFDNMVPYAVKVNEDIKQFIREQCKDEKPKAFAKNVYQKLLGGRIR